MKNDECFLSSEKFWCEKKIFLQIIALIKMFMQTSSRLNKDVNKAVVWSQVRIEFRPSENAFKVEYVN